MTDIGTKIGAGIGMEIRAAVDADGDALWAMLEPAIRAGA
jgi:hypothetical protein